MASQPQVVLPDELLEELELAVAVAVTVPLVELDELLEVVLVPLVLDEAEALLEDVDPPLFTEAMTNPDELEVEIPVPEVEEVELVVELVEELDVATAALAVAVDDCVADWVELELVLSPEEPLADPLLEEWELVPLEAVEELAWPELLAALLNDPPELAVEECVPLELTPLEAPEAEAAAVLAVLVEAEAEAVAAPVGVPLSSHLPAEHTWLLGQSAEVEHGSPVSCGLHPTPSKLAPRMARYRFRIDIRSSLR